MADPNFRLQKGKLIDTQQGFTDAFNFVYENLHGLKGGQGVDIDKSLDGAWQINADENAGENEGGGNGAGVYDVIEDSQEDRDGITIQYTDDRQDSFIPFPQLSSLSGTYVTNVKGNQYSQRLSIDFSDGTNSTVYLPNAITAISREKSWVSYDDVLSARLVNGGTQTAYLGITLSGTDNYGSNQATEFAFVCKRDSNVQIHMRGNQIEVGVYYI